MVTANTLKFVIVGHIDHGKSTMIGRLLFNTNSLPSDRIEEMKKQSKNLSKETEFAFLIDHLQEEREKGMTIDTSQNFFKTEKREYIIIDAPGHAELIKNMLTGASQAEAAILIVDVKEGVKQQTKRHAYMLSLLGLDQVIVVLNKMDLAKYQKDVFDKIQGDIQKVLDSLKITPKNYIPISALRDDNISKKSENMVWYQGPTVLEALDLLAEKSSMEGSPLVLPVQDVYQIDQKMIIVGQIESGKITDGQKIKIFPAKHIVHVKSIEKFNENPAEASCGENIGITVKEPIFIKRGNVIFDSGAEPVLTDSFHANIFWIGQESLNIKEPLILKCATQEGPAMVTEIKKRINSATFKVTGKGVESLKFLEVGEVVIKTQKEIVIKKFTELAELGRFVLLKNKNIAAGGIIV